MITDTEAIILRQVKAANGRRMILMFSRKFGKISVGTNITEGGKTKSALSIRPFTYGRYELFKSRDNYNLNSGQVLKSYYRIGENLDKYIGASYVLELTEKLLVETLPQPKLFSLLLDFLEAIEKREKRQDTLVMAYVVKLLDLMGTMPSLEGCACCGKIKIGGNRFFSVEEGGMICEDCCKLLRSEHNEPLIYDGNFGIVKILQYFQKEPFSAFKKIALDEKVSNHLKVIMKEYIAYHLDVGKLKSESFNL